uniref:DUF834 domain-containing protein n=1 Tax=Oryza rufipogon TaxID=4529 RepID=A0A0E0N3K9_ORYRU
MSGWRHCHAAVLMGRLMGHARSLATCCRFAVRVAAVVDADLSSGGGLHDRRGRARWRLQPPTPGCRAEFVDPICTAEIHLRSCCPTPCQIRRCRGASHPSTRPNAWEERGVELVARFLVASTPVAKLAVPSGDRKGTVTKRRGRPEEDRGWSEEEERRGGRWRGDAVCCGGDGVERDVTMEKKSSLALDKIRAGLEFGRQDEEITQEKLPDCAFVLR